MAITPLITKAEADVFNALSSAWLALTDDLKDFHIYNASVYMQTRWTCTDVEWDDTTTLDEDLKRACAYYAEADRLETLMAPVSDIEHKGRIVEETGKVDTLLETTKYSDSGTTVTGGNNLQSIDAIMSIYCTALNANSVKLVRD